MGGSLPSSQLPGLVAIQVPLKDIILLRGRGQKAKDKVKLIRKLLQNYSDNGKDKNYTYVRIKDIK